MADGPAGRPVDVREILRVTVERRLRDQARGFDTFFDPFSRPRITGPIRTLSRASSGTRRGRSKSRARRIEARVSILLPLVRFRQVAAALVRRLPSTRTQLVRRRPHLRHFPSALVIPISSAVSAKWPGLHADLSRKLNSLSSKGFNRMSWFCLLNAPVGLSQAGQPEAGVAPLTKALVKALETFLQENRIFWAETSPWCAPRRRVGASQDGGPGRPSGCSLSKSFVDSIMTR